MTFIGFFSPVWILQCRLRIDCLPKGFPTFTAGIDFLSIQSLVKRVRDLLWLKAATLSLEFRSFFPSLIFSFFITEFVGKLFLSISHLCDFPSAEILCGSEKIDFKWKMLLNTLHLANTFPNGTFSKGGHWSEMLYLIFILPLQLFDIIQVLVKIWNLLFCCVVFLYYHLG